MRNPVSAAATVRAVSFGALPYLTWLAGLAVLTVLASRSLFSEMDAATARIASFATYVTTGTIAILLAGLSVLYAFSCSLMLSWLEENVRPAQVVRAVCLGYWAIAANVWIGACAVMVDPPPSLSLDELLHGTELSAESLLGFGWFNELRHLTTAGFMALCFWALARTAKPFNALLAVLFAASAVAFLVAALSWLGDTGL